MVCRFGASCHNQPFLSQEFKKQRILGEMAGLRISRSKEVTFDIKVTIEISCLMDFSDYPFDDHTCSFQVAPPVHLTLAAPRYFQNKFLNFTFFDHKIFCEFLRKSFM